jgi:hypothetical protein
VQKKVDVAKDITERLPGAARVAVSGRTERPAFVAGLRILTLAVHLQRGEGQSSHRTFWQAFGAQVSYN